MQKILITIDGSADGTADIVRSMQQKYPIIALCAHKTRLGKTARLNELYQANTSDYLFTLDDDVILGTDREVETVLERARQTGAHVVAADQIPCTVAGFVRRILYANHCLWTEVRRDVNGGDYIQNLQGSATLLTRKFARRLHYPVGIPCDQKYLYIKAARSHVFAFSPKNQVIYQPIGTVGDWIRLNQRISSEDHWLHASFGKHIPELYNPPRQDRLRGMVAQIKKDPFFTLLAIGMCYLFRLILPLQRPTVTGLWPTLTSTKEAIDSKRMAGTRGLLVATPFVSRHTSSVIWQAVHTAYQSLFVHGIHTFQFLHITHGVLRKPIG